MNILTTELPGVLIIEPRVFRDARGIFMETWNRPRYEAAGIAGEMPQDNLSWSARGVIRGLHYQYPCPQGKLVFVPQGEVFDVAVDVRIGSPNFGRWLSVILSSENRRQLYVPPGFAHGFCVVSEGALVAYKCTDMYRADCDASLAWNDPRIGIEWPISEPVLSDKDAAAPKLDKIDSARLPKFS